MSNYINKLIRKGVTTSDKYFKDIINVYTRLYKNSKDFEEFLAYEGYSPINTIMTNYHDNMVTIISNSLNDIRFNRPSQKALYKTVIDTRTSSLITKVNDDTRQAVRDIIKKSYQKGDLSYKTVAEEITKTCDTINSARARAIARTELNNATTTADYIINKERGANVYSYQCAGEPCEVCEEDCGKVFHIDDIDHLPPRHPNSYHKDTKVFTSKGWKPVSDITYEDKLATLNPETEQIEFYNPKGLVSHYENELIEIKDKWFNIQITKDHDCFIHQRRDGGKHGRYMEPQFRKPSELTSESKFVRTISSDRECDEYLNINGVTIHKNDYAFLMAWYLSEGSCNRDNYIVIAQLKSDIRDYLKSELAGIADRLNSKFYEWKQGFALKNDNLLEYLKVLGHSHEKYIPKELFKLDNESLQIFLDNYLLGDGHKRTSKKYNSVEECIFTSSIRLRDGICFIAVLCGYNPTIYKHSKKGKLVKHHNGDYVQNYDVWGIRLNRTHYTKFKSSMMSVKGYDDIVYCVDLPPYHTLLVCFDGKTSWNGNCCCGVTFYYDPNVE